MALRPSSDVTLVLVLARKHFTAEAADVRPLAGGEFSRAYAFTVGDRAYVIRLSAFPHAAEAFAKDGYAWRHFASAALPIPRVLAVGRCGDDHVAISEQVAGRRVAELAEAERRALLPAVLDTFDAIARVDVGGTRGFGAWGADGHGRHTTWRGLLADAMANRAEGYYQDWHALFETSFLERRVYELVYWHMLDLAVYCPEERALLHCDYHFDNVLTDGRRITGVIDWGNAAYGDPLHDAAWVAGVFLKDYNLDVAPLLRERHGASPGFAERMACYACHIGLDDMRFFAKTGRREQYEQTRNRLLGLVAGEAMRLW